MERKGTTGAGSATARVTRPRLALLAGEGRAGARGASMRLLAPSLAACMVVQMGLDGAEEGSAMPTRPLHPPGTPARAGGWRVGGGRHGGRVAGGYSTTGQPVTPIEDQATTPAVSLPGLPTLPRAPRHQQTP